jgi:hypothetical protein
MQHAARPVHLLAKGGTMKTHDPMPILLAACSAHAAGLSILPIKADGSKKQALPEWKRWQQHQPPLALVHRWFDKRVPLGLAVIGGQVSGNLEILDFDRPDRFAAFAEAAHALGLGDVLSRMKAGYFEESPNGNHVLYRCTEIASNTKLALTYDLDAQGNRKLTEQGTPLLKVLIETRGEGGYCIIAPSAGTVHETGKPYVLLSGSLETIATITPEERADLLALARTFDELEREPQEEPRVTPTPASGERPGDLFNAKATWADVLVGWTKCYETGGVTHWRRPGKDRGTSATTNFQGSDLFYCFSSSTGFEVERGYSKFSAYALLNHAGDYHAAAQALGTLGYGNGYSYAADFSDIEDEAPPHQEKEQPGARARTDEPPPPRMHPGTYEPILIKATDVTPELVHYLWAPYFPLKKIALVGGDGGVGKTFLMLAVATSATLGRWPFLWSKKASLTTPADVIFFTTEDGIADTLRPRLDALGADLTRVHFTGGKRDWRGGKHGIILSDEAVIAKAIALTQAKLAVFDPFQAFLPPGTNMNKMETVRPVLTTLYGIAEANGCSLSLLGHLSKSKQETASYKFIGSVDWFNGARSAMMLLMDPDNPPHGRLFFHVKQNLTAKAPGWKFDLSEDLDPPFQWGASTEQTAEEVIAGSSQESKVREAELFLRGELANGERPQLELEESAKIYHISRISLRRAKDVLHIHSRKVGFGPEGYWLWELPLR